MDNTTCLIEQNVIQWLEKVVIGLGLCPFAKKPFDEERVRIRVDFCETEEAVFKSIIHECSILDDVDASEIETSLLVVPALFKSFENFNDFLFDVNDLLVLKGWEGVYQIASFHPDYQFAGTLKTDAENFTNRAPYPIFHIIREAGLSKAIAHYPDVENIPERNIKLMNSYSEQALKRIFYWCFD